MPGFSAPKIEPLAGHHDRAGFRCGEPALDDYLRRQASQDVKRKIERIFVAVGADDTEVVGYYSLSAASFLKSELPLSLAKRLPRYPVPAAILGRLAVSEHHQGQRIGKFLLFDALNRVLGAGAHMAVYAVIVDAKDDAARAFYLRYGFQPFAEQPMRLFLPMSTLAQGATARELGIHIKPQ